MILVVLSTHAELASATARECSYCETGELGSQLFWSRKNLNTRNRNPMPGEKWRRFLNLWSKSVGAILALYYFNYTHTTIGQTQVNFVDFHRWFETNSWILMSHMSFDRPTSFSFRLTCPIQRYCRPTSAITVLWCFIGVCWNAPLVTVFR